MKFRGNLMTVASRMWYADCVALLPKEGLLTRWTKVWRIWYTDQHKARRMFS